MLIRRFLQTVQRVRARLGFGGAGLIALVGGAVVLLASLVTFGGATEDVTQHNGFVHHDVADLRFFTHHRTGFVSASKLLTQLGAVPVLALLVIVSGFLLWRRGLRLALALAPAVSLGAAATAVAITKNIVGRARPPVSLHLVSEGDASFPSGHATNSAAAFLTIALVLAVCVLRRPIMRALSVASAALLTGAIGASRLVLGVHWPSDVLAGWALGLSVALAVTMTAVLLARLTPPTADGAGWRVRRLMQWLAAERRPRDLRAV